MPLSTTQAPNKKHLIGSTTRIAVDGCAMIQGHTGEHVAFTARQKREIQGKIRSEQAALSRIRALYVRCKESENYNPTNDELKSFLDDMRLLWVLLPPLRRHQGEKAGTCVIRIFREVNAFRQVNMSQ